MNSDNLMVFCTLFDSYYLDKGLALYQSMKRHIEDFKLYIFAFDDRSYEVLSAMHLKKVILVSLEEIMNERLGEIKKERTRAEFCWTCTPIVIEHVLTRYGEKACTYIDADIYFFNSPQNALQEIVSCRCSVGITPHRFEKTYTSIEPMFNNGKYCIEFNTFFNNRNGLQVLMEWKEDCLDWCYLRYEDGKLGDQKYVDAWKRRYSCIHESENLGIGVAPWNLHLYRYDREKEGEIRIRYREKCIPLVFYHFEGMKYLNNGKVFLNLWKYDSARTDTKARKIYGEYFRELGQVRKYLKDIYGIGFEHMQIDKDEFLKNYSLKHFCKDIGLLGGLKTWIGFRRNNLMRVL